MANKNVKIFMYLRDKQTLGYVKIIENQPRYGFSRNEATLFTEEEARKLCSTFSNKYICKLIIPKNDIKKRRYIETSAEIITEYI